MSKAIHAFLFGSVLAINVNAVQAGFLQPGSTGTITVTGGCFTFYPECGMNVYPDAFTDNGITVNGIGSAIGGDGIIGYMNFTVTGTGNTFDLTSFNMDTYTYTAGGDFATRMVDTSNAGGSIDDSGNMILDLTGRTGIFYYFADSLGENPWNTNKRYGSSEPATYYLLTTGTSSIPIYNTSLTGTPLSQTGVGTWAGTLVSAGRMSSDWGAIFDGTPYTEIFNITVTGTPVPIPAAVWLFGSGLLGLVGMARRKQKI
jgi:hypothetical protein